MPATPAWLAAVEAMLNRGVHASLQATTLVRRLEGTALRIDIEGMTAIRASAACGRLALVADQPAEAASMRVDASIAGSPLALLQLAGAAGGRDGASRSAQYPSAQVRGDAEIADSYRRLFAMAKPDFEEELSRLVGDLPARRLSQLAKQTLTWARRARRTAGENIAEYLQEESRDLVNKTEFEEFLRGVDVLRETADRVEARIARLEQMLKGAD